MNLVYLADIRFPMERANGIQTAETVHALARRGHTVLLVVRKTDARDDRDCLAFFGLPEHPRLRLSRIRVPRRGARLAFIGRSLAVMRRSGAELVYTRDLGLAYAAIFLQRLPVVYEAIALQTAFREEAATLYEGRKPPSALRRSWQRHVERTVFRRTKGVIATTSHLLAAIEQGFGKPRLSTVIPNGTRVPAEPPPPPPVGARPHVYYVGQLYPWKGVDFLLDAMTHLPDADLVVVGGLPGEPDLDRLRAKADSLGIATRVTFRGYVPRTEIAHELEKADILVIPHAESRTAREFTSPLKLFEALAAGRPIVATDLPSVREILEDGVTALLAPPGDPRALAGRLRAVISDRELAARLARNGFARARDYSWEERARRIEAFLQEVTRA